MYSRVILYKELTFILHSYLSLVTLEHVPNPNPKVLIDCYLHSTR